MWTSLVGSQRPETCLYVTAPFLDSTSNQSTVDLEAVGIRSYVAEPDRGRRDWSEEPAAQAPVYRNRRRIRRHAGSQRSCGDIRFLRQFGIASDYARLLSP